MIYKGNPVSAGIAIGSAFVYDPKILTAPEDAPVLPMECELERYMSMMRAKKVRIWTRIYDSSLLFRFSLHMPFQFTRRKALSMTLSR